MLFFLMLPIATQSNCLQSDKTMEALMTTTLDIINSAKDLDPAEYRAFFLQSKAPLFYDLRFLIAAEQSPLLNVSKIFYLLARDEGRLIALVPLYLQEFRSADPLGLLISSAKLSIESEERDCLAILYIVRIPRYRR